MPRKHILAFGNPVYDLITTPERMIRERVLSGCSTNACLAAARLGYGSTLVGTIGDDFRARIHQELQQWDVRAQLSHSQHTGGFSLVYYDDQGNRHLSILGIAAPIPATYDLSFQPDFILLGPILGEISIELVRNLRSAYQGPILLDPQGLLRLTRDGKVLHELTSAFVEIAALSTIIKANELETLVATGIHARQDPEAAVKALYKFGGQIAVVTLAEAGSIIYDGKDIYMIPPYTTHAIDPTGAGDTYAAGFMVRYLETPENLTEVGCFASSVASVMVENSGPEFELTRAEIDFRTSQLLKAPLELKI